MEQRKKIQTEFPMAANFLQIKLDAFARIMICIIFKIFKRFCHNFASKNQEAIQYTIDEKQFLEF